MPICGLYIHFLNYAFDEHIFKNFMESYLFSISILMYLNHEAFSYSKKKKIFYGILEAPWYFVDILGDILFQIHNSLLNVKKDYFMVFSYESPVVLPSFSKTEKIFINHISDKKIIMNP